MSCLLDSAAVTRALALRDLTDPQQGEHGMQLMLDRIHSTLAERWQCARQLYRGSPVVSVEDNYQRLGCAVEQIEQEAAAARYIAPGLLLRTHPSALMPSLLRAMVWHPPEDLLLICPGLSYLETLEDSLTCSESHQVALWRVCRGVLSSPELGEMVQTALRTALPDVAYRTVPTRHAYLRACVQLDAKLNGQWVEVGKCGLVASDTLRGNGLDPSDVSAVAMELSLDRLLMIRKGVPDIGLLRSVQPGVAIQMQDLSRYRAVAGDSTADSKREQAREESWRSRVATG